MRNRRSLKYREETVNSAQLLKSNHQHEWLIESLLLRGQPAVLAGPKKALKTSILVDLALSLGTGKPFLGHFPLFGEPCRVLFLSGELSEASIANTVRSIRRQRGMDTPLRVAWSFRCFKLAKASDQRDLYELIKSQRAQVVIIDPLPAYFPTVDVSMSAVSAFDGSPLLWHAARICLNAGATPVFGCNSIKTAGKRSGPKHALPHLDDLPAGGAAEFARQWILLRRGDYSSDDTRQHDLVMLAGGNAGHSAAWDLSIDEGECGEDFMRSKWKVMVEEHA